MGALFDPYTPAAPPKPPASPERMAELQVEKQEKAIQTEKDKLDKEKADATALAAAEIARAMGKRNNTTAGMSAAKRNSTILTSPSGLSSGLGGKGKTLLGM